jgi:hypothetical protein
MGKQPPRPTLVPEPTITPTRYGYLATWPESDVAIEIHRPEFSRLKAEIVARLGEVIVNQAEIALLNQRDRVDFHGLAALRDGQVPWESYLMSVIAPLQVSMQQPRDAADATERSSSPWEHIKPAPAFLAEPEVPFEGLAKDLLAPGAITIISAPKGLGKTQVALNLGVALATGGIFRGEVVKPVRVLVLDRDNPEAVLKQRLRNWGAATAERLHVLTRRHAPDLKDREAWAQFPLGDYDVLILDAVGSFTEGITEKEGRLTTEVLATLLDLARRGIAILLLNNVTKDGTNFKGREEWADRVDIMYEVRDATGFTPSGRGDWWVELPSAAEYAWAERAQRRKGTVTFRLAFIPSKFRFCLELHLPPEGLWTLKDVTSAIMQAGEDAQRDAMEAKNAQREAAAQALAERLASGPLNKTDAESLLREDGIGRNEARQLVKMYEGTLWTISAGEGKGAPQVLFRVGGGENDHTGEPLGDKALPDEHFRRLGTQGGANGASADPLPERAAEPHIFSATHSEIHASTCEHGIRGLVREGEQLICGLCLGMPVERVEQLRKGACRC